MLQKRVEVRSEERTDSRIRETLRDPCYASNMKMAEDRQAIETGAQLVLSVAKAASTHLSWPTYLNH